MVITPVPHLILSAPPRSRDSIAKMLGRVGVGKGLNIKGKSAQKNRLSGFVPFLQIHDNAHKVLVEASPKDARTKVPPVLSPIACPGWMPPPTMPPYSRPLVSPDLL